MAFESVSVRLAIGSAPPVSQWSQAAAVGSVVTFALSDTTGVNSYQWVLAGRPEGSGAAGGGPEPLSLGNASTASLTLDVAGTYVVWCVVNGGGTNSAVLRSGVAILESVTDPVGRPLRLLGPNETDEDIADPLVAQGWIKQLNRWLKKIEASGGGGSVDVASWAIANVRYFLLDSDGGSDSNPGYIDAPPGTDLTGMTAGLAIQTTDRLEAIIPHVGAGRMAVVLIKPRLDPVVHFVPVTYDKTTTDDGLGRIDRRLLSGYSLLHARGSDLTNSLADRAQLGMVTRIEQIGGGVPTGGTVSGLCEYTIATVSGNRITATVNICLFPQQMVGCRARFVTASSGTFYGQVQWGDLSSTPDPTAITFYGLPAAPAPGDAFFLEWPGAAMHDLYEATTACQAPSTSYALAPSLEIAGLAVFNNMLIGSNEASAWIPTSYCCLQAWPEANVEIQGTLACTGNYTDETGTTIGTNNVGFASFAEGGVYCTAGVESIDLSFCGLFGFCELSALSIVANYSTFENAGFQNGVSALELTGIQYGALSLLHAGAASLQSVRWVPYFSGGYSGGITIDPDNGHSVKGAAGVSVALGDVQQAYGPALGVPGITLASGRYTVTIDSGDNPISGGTGITVLLDDTESNSFLLSYASLQVTGFEIEGMQRVISQVRGAGYADDTLPCPRGVPMIQVPEVGAQGPGLVVCSPTPGYFNFASADSYASYPPIGVTLTNTVGGAYAIVGNAGIMCLAIAPESGVPANGAMVYLEVGSDLPGACSDVPGYSNDVPLGVALAVPQTLPNETGVVQVAWQLPVLLDQWAYLIDDFAATNTTSPANVSELAVVLQPERIYEFEMHLYLTTDVSGVGGFALGISGAVLEAVVGSLLAYKAGSSPALLLAVAGNALAGDSLVGAQTVLWIAKGTFSTTLGGTLTPTFAQAVATSTGSMIVSGSYFKIIERGGIAGG